MSNLPFGRTTRALVAVPALALALPALAGTINVPQQHPTIQAAINAAVNGDTVIVAPGVYSGPGNRDISLMGKAITLRSAAGAQTCIINAADPLGGAHCGFLLQHSETGATVIDGFTVTGGYMFNGGGIYVHNGSPTIRNCIITGNSVACWGGGVYTESNSSPRFYNCTVVGNSSTDEGGGFFCVSSNPHVEGCVIANNTANAGGGVCVFAGQPTFVNCRITGNYARYTGGGLYLWGGKMVNCTVADNQSGYYGSGIYSGSGAVVANSILWANKGAPQAEGQPNITYSIVQGGFAGIGNRNSDPRFVNPAAGNYRVSVTSPAIDAGLNQAVPAGVVVDLAGQPRFFGPGGTPIVDIGAFEMVPTFNTSRPR
jgi:hypothetical protein